MKQFDKDVEKELQYLQLGYLTYYILKIIEGLPKVEMQPYYALILQELENTKRLGTGKSLLYSRLKNLNENEFVETSIGASSNPKAKKKVQFYTLTEKGKRLLKNLDDEQKRIHLSLKIYR